MVKCHCLERYTADFCDACRVKIRKLSKRRFKVNPKPFCAECLRV